MTTLQTLEHLGHSLRPPPPTELRKYETEIRGSVYVCDNCGWAYVIGRPSGRAVPIGESLSQKDTLRRETEACSAVFTERTLAQMYGAVRSTIHDTMSLRAAQNVFAAAGLLTDDLSAEAGSHWQSYLASMDRKFSTLRPAEKFAAIKILAERGRSTSPRFVDKLRPLLLQQGFAEQADLLAPLPRDEESDDIGVEVDQGWHNSDKEPAAKGESMSNSCGEKLVFIIHGRDEANLLKLEKLVKDEWHLKPIVLMYEPGKGRTLIEKFEEEARGAVFAFALLTPDDLIKTDREEYIQPRPNVAFELGWFYAQLDRKHVCILLRAGTHLHSDLDGISRIEFNRSVDEKVIEIRKELEAAGLIEKR